MKVIDLLNEIEKGKVPFGTRFSIDGEVFTYVKSLEGPQIVDKHYNDVFQTKNLYFLKNKIEIIEEDKPIEKLDYEINENNVDVCTEKIRCKINEIIDEVNKLKK